MTNQQQNRQYYKSRGICIRCGKRYAEPSLTLCYECGKDNRDRAERWRKALTGQAYGQYLSKARSAKKNLYERRKAEGLCTRCGNRPPMSGYLKCHPCTEAQRTHYKPKINGIPRSEYGRHGLCLECGEPAMTGGKLCEKHHNIHAASARRLDRSAHPWKRDNDIAFAAGYTP